MKKTLTKVALRYRALFLGIDREDIDITSEVTVPASAFVARLKENGFCVSEELLHALNAVSADTLAELTDCVNDVMGVNLNWASLVKGWDVPTGESCADHIITWIANICGGKKSGYNGTTLPCGHFIPDGTFPLERYNGCPFCGRPFKTADFVYKGQGSKLKELRLFTEDDIRNVFVSLLTSSTPLDATQKDSLKLLLYHYPLPADIVIPMKETSMLVVTALVRQGKADEACVLLKTPVDILRYLWYEKTGHVQIIEPKALVVHAMNMHHHMWGPLDKGLDAAKEMTQNLKLKYDRKVCFRVAKWLNAIPMTAAQAAENMNPKRGMWVRMIRALRLGEYSRKPGMEHLAETYFDIKEPRVARPITGVTRRINANKLLGLYNDEAREEMVKSVNEIYKSSMERRFASMKTEAKTIYIDPALYNIPVSVGDRISTVQDASCALMGTRFPVDGETVRLFLQWGKGLHAQPLDMDLSCRIALPEGKTDYCYFGNLTCHGAKHSGDIREIPEMVGTAEYIDLSLPELEAEGANYVTFTCNAYSYGALSPNLVVGWMDSACPMKISKITGVAYDPSCVRHMVRISEANLSKGLVFGVLDIAKREIIWLEMPFTSQIIHNADNKSIEAILRRLEEKISIGELLELKAKGQNLKLAESSVGADEAYTYDWALNPAEVSRLLSA